MKNKMNKKNISFKTACIGVVILQIVFISLSFCLIVNIFELYFVQIKILIMWTIFKFFIQIVFIIILYNRFKDKNIYISDYIMIISMGLFFSIFFNFLILATPFVLFVILSYKDIPDKIYILVYVFLLLDQILFAFCAGVLENNKYFPDRKHIVKKKKTKHKKNNMCKKRELKKNKNIFYILDNFIDKHVFNFLIWLDEFIDKYIFRIKDK